MTMTGSILTDKVDVEGDVAGVHLCDADHLLLARGDTVRVVRPPLPLPSCRALPGGVHCNLVFFLLDVDMLCLVIFICYIIRWFRPPIHWTKTIQLQTKSFAQTMKTCKLFQRNLQSHLYKGHSLHSLVLTPQFSVLRTQMAKYLRFGQLSCLYLNEDL